MSRDGHGVVGWDLCHLADLSLSDSECYRLLLKRNQGNNFGVFGGRTLNDLQTRFPAETSRKEFFSRHGCLRQLTTQPP